MKSVRPSVGAALIFPVRSLAPALFPAARCETVGVSTILDNGDRQTSGQRHAHRHANTRPVGSALQPEKQRADCERKGSCKPVHCSGCRCYCQRRGPYRRTFVVRAVESEKREPQMGQVAAGAFCRSSPARCIIVCIYQSRGIATSRPLVRPSLLVNERRTAINRMEIKSNPSNCR